MNRRRFLKTGGNVASALLAGTAADLAGTLRGIGQRDASIPYVDGLSLLSPDPGDVADSGLSAFVLDASAGDYVPAAEGTRRYYRSFEASLQSIAHVRERLDSGAVPGAFVATRGSEILPAYETGSTAVFLQFQGAEPIEQDLTRLDLFFETGLRILQITHHYSNSWGGGALERLWGGLTPVGFEGVERLDELGIVPDLSHVADPACLDVLAASRQPAIISHGAARALVPSARCTPDNIIRGVADSGGVMGVFMMSFWLTTERVPTAESYVRQIRHVANVGGIDAAAVANDFTVAGDIAAARLDNDNAEAVKRYLPWWEGLRRAGVLGFDAVPRHVVIPEFNTVRRMFRIHEALDRAGFTTGEVEKIMGGNWIRVLTESLG